MQGYEPYILAVRARFPWYDERLRGYGWDKIAHMLLMARDLNLSVHPTAFVIHRDHIETHALKIARKPAHWTKVFQSFKVTRTILQCMFYNDACSPPSNEQGKHTFYIMCPLINLCMLQASSQWLNCLMHYLCHTCRCVLTIAKY